MKLFWYFSVLVDFNLPENTPIQQVPGVTIGNQGCVLYIDVVPSFDEVDGAEGEILTGGKHVTTVSSGEIHVQLLAIQSATNKSD
jgi:hypothetical protein